MLRQAARGIGNMLLHYKCEECHHEWDGVKGFTNWLNCDWCGAQGVVLSEEAFIALDKLRVRNNV